MRRLRVSWGRERLSHEDVRYQIQGQGLSYEDACHICYNIAKGKRKMGQMYNMFGDTQEYRKKQT